MSYMDDIFDLREHLKKAPIDIKKAWKNHEDLFYAYMLDADKYSALADGLTNVLEILVAKAPDYTRTILAKIESGKDVQN